MIDRGSDRAYRVPGDRLLKDRQMTRPIHARRRCMTGASAICLVLVAVLSGCGSLNLRKVDREVDQHAHNAGTAMDNVRYGGSVERARAVAGTVGQSGDVNPDQSRTTIEVLQADGGRRDGTIVLRITEILGPSSEFGRTTSATRCYRYTYRRSIHDGEPHRVSHCASVPALVLPPPPPVPDLPADAEDRLRAVFTRFPAAGVQDPTVIKQAVTRAFAGTIDLFVDVQIQDGDIGVGIGIPGTDNNAGECELAHVTPRSGAPDTVELWRMPAVLAQPGETPCTGYTALTNQGQQPPH